MDLTPYKARVRALLNDTTSSLGVLLVAFSGDVEQLSQAIVSDLAAQIAGALTVVFGMFRSYVNGDLKKGEGHDGA